MQQTQILVGGHQRLRFVTPNFDGVCGRVRAAEEVHISPGPEGGTLVLVILASVKLDLSESRGISHLIKIN